MAYADSKMSRVGYANGNSLWLYIQATDALATIVASGYFNSKYAELAKGDVILCVDTNVPTTDVLSVTSTTGATTVTTQNGT